MKVILSGFNLDIETIKELRDFVQRASQQLNGSWLEGRDPVSKREIIQQLQQEAFRLVAMDNFTPETLSAAYARISRNPLPVNQLREIARQEVDRARKSNQNIIFGLGHSSVAEHAVFNFDILGVSRYAVETIEHFRLASYTEKSQRYILFENDFVIPPEIRGTLLEKDFVEIIQEQSAVYYRLYELLKPYFFERYPREAEDPKQHKTLEGLAKEDARYVISLAVQTQLGMTVNARTLENMIAKCNSHPLAEVREYGNQLYRVTREYTPSIVKYVDPSPYLLHKNDDIRQFIDSSFSSPAIRPDSAIPEVFLLDFNRDLDNLLLAAVLFRQCNLNFPEALSMVSRLSFKDRKQFYQVLFKDLNLWDSVLREFEFANFTFQLIVSASCYGQLKRHRMVNMIVQNYDISLGVTVPDSIRQIGKETIFWEIIEKTENIHNKIRSKHPDIAPYILSNSHRRRVLMRINLRELYHFSRLREDQHAQWDIRAVAVKMGDLVREKLPLAAALIGGKNNFNDHYIQFMNS